MNGTAEYALLSVTNPTMTTMPNTPAVWGPHHQSDVFTSSRSAGGGYWWAIAAGTVLACFSTLANHDTLAIAVLTLVLSAAAAAVGSYEARLNRQFASGHWLLFAIAALASSTVFFVPTLAYTVGFLGRQRVSKAVLGGGAPQEILRYDSYAEGIRTSCEPPVGPLVVLWGPLGVI